MKLVLFDIDGTLLFCDGAGRKSISEAVNSVFGVGGFPEGYSLAGCTDKQIVSDVLNYYKIPQPEIDSKMTEVLDAYYEFLKINTSSGAHNKRLLDGVNPLLEHLRNDADNILLGLLTGNLERTASLKLNLFDLEKYFLYDGKLLGGFGSDHFERSRLVNISVKRAFNLTGRIFVGKDIVILGDTKNDILCGKHMGVKSIGVATGEFSAEELWKYEPDFVFDDFTDTKAVIEKILN